MSTDKLRQDATPSSRATIYHLCVAVEQCYELREGQKLLIEELGDVTIESYKQIEVKQYADYLTDGHPNFWNTLHNWMDDRFNHTPYVSLILHTTQQFGPKANITHWNSSDNNYRLAILLSINAGFETAYRKRKKADHSASASIVLEHQRFVLHSARRTKLKEIIDKVRIEARAKELPCLYEELKLNRVRGVLSGKKDDYMNSLIGFICRADKKKGERWEISYEEFESKLSELNAIFNSETRRFPRKYFSTHKQSADNKIRDELFVKKIKDIKYHEVICDAIHDYEATIMTIDTEFGSYSVDPSTIEGYAFDVKNRFLADYRTACRNCTHVLRDSKNLYDRTIGNTAPALPGFGDTPDGFRNGLLHQQMNTPDTNLKWRLCKT